MTGKLKIEKYGKTNKYVALRIWSKYPEVKPKEFWKELRLFFIALVKGMPIKEALETFPKAYEIIEALP